MDADLQYTSEMGDGDRLKQLYEAAGFTSLAAFAREAGIPEGTATKHKNRDSIPSEAGEKYIEAAKKTGADIAWLLTGKGIAPKSVELYLQSQTRLHKLDISPTDNMRPLDASDMAAIPLWVADMTDAGATVQVAKTANTVPGPGDLRGLHSAFAVRVWEDINAPWLPRGSTAFVDPTHNGRDGDWCIFAASIEKDDTVLVGPTIGILIGATPIAWRVQRGGARVTLPRRDYPLVWKIVYIKP